MNAAVLTVKDVCRETSLSRTTLWRLVKQGAIVAPLQLSPGRVGFRASDVEAYTSGLKQVAR